MAAMSWLRDTENLEATVGAFFLVDVAAAEEEPPGSSLENRAEMNWGEVGWKGRTTLIILRWLSPIMIMESGCEITSLPPPISSVLQLCTCMYLCLASL